MSTASRARDIARRGACRHPTLNYETTQAIRIAAKQIYDESVAKGIKTTRKGTKRALAIIMRTSGHVDPVKARRVGFTEMLTDPAAAITVPEMAAPPAPSPTMDAMP